MIIFIFILLFPFLTYAEENISLKVNTNAWEAILTASPVVQLTLLVLIIMSIICWSVIFFKNKELNLIYKANAPFLYRFWKAKSLDNVLDDTEIKPASSLGRIFKAGYVELQKIADSPLVNTNSPNPPNNDLKNDLRREEGLKLTGLDNIERSLRIGIGKEVEVLEKKLNFLATTGSTAPFIGLFGTVWGIMGAFNQIGLSGSANLAVVAPGISEALVSTAIGLLAAIPAVIAYNHFLSRIKKAEMELNNFAADFLNIIKRNFFRGS